MKELSVEMEWFVVTLQNEFDVVVNVADVSVEAVELGLDEVEEVFVPQEIMGELSETLLFEIMVVDDADGNTWVGAVGFHVDSPHWCIRAITKNGQMIIRKVLSLEGRD